MIKKIMVTYLWCHMIALHAQDHKAPSAPATPKPVTFSGAVPIKIDAPALAQFGKEAAAALGLKEAMATLSSSDVLARATAGFDLPGAAAALPKKIEIGVSADALAQALKNIDITVKSDDLKKALEALSANIDHKVELQLKAPPQPVQLEVTVSKEVSEYVTDIIGDAGLKVGAVVGLGCCIQHGGSCCLLCPLAIMFTSSYRSLKDSTKPSCIFLKDQLARCFARKQHGSHLN